MTDEGDSVEDIFAKILSKKELVVSERLNYTDNYYSKKLQKDETVVVNFQIFRDSVTKLYNALLFNLNIPLGEVILLVLELANYSTTEFGSVVTELFTLNFAMEECTNFCIQYSVFDLLIELFHVKVYLTSTIISRTAFIQKRTRDEQFAVVRYCQSPNLNALSWLLESNHKTKNKKEQFKQQMVDFDVQDLIKNFPKRKENYLFGRDPDKHLTKITANLKTNQVFKEINAQMLEAYTQALLFIEVAFEESANIDQYFAGISISRA